ncbi:hypothetical protein [Crateriforma conspicua]|uniref:Uncharacterized protein n=1 Tax=Crateriforma conspicua TaxID=2527996 RepID=A0A5C5Y9B4_9PLAN|nr:hypothetical protein [Crateriforma conspicua]QDV65514.1 hypothetical protein Mal65_46850 [Crateriforma conspicua]TWT70905.1 hypothetical protein Pan14r_32130 [Crateriforma conspicua]
MHLPAIPSTADPEAGSQFIIGGAASKTTATNENVESHKPGFIDRRQGSGGRGGHNERRQFGSSHAELSQEGRELALAIDQYKLQNHRRYITCDEMLKVLHQLGYQRVS